MSESVPALGVLLVLIVPPGLGAVLALYPPGMLSLATRVALVFGLGFVITGGLAFGLTILSVLGPITFLALVVPVTVTLWVVALRRASLRTHARALAEELRADRGSLVVGFVVLAAIAGVYTTYLADFPTGTPFRYWVDGMELADAGGIPRQTLHYGALFPPVTSKMFLNAFTAGAHYVTSWNVPGAIQGMLWIAAVGMAAGLWATARELGLRYAAPLVPVLLVANRVVLGDEMTGDLTEYRAEVIGRFVAFAFLPLALRTLRERRRLDATVAAVGLGAAAGTHLVSFGAVAIVIGWYGLARFVLDADRRRLLRPAAALAGMTAVVAPVVLLLPRGEIGFEGAASPGSYRRTDVPFDKSRFLFSGDTRPADQPPRGAFYVPPGGVVHTFVQEAFDWEPGSPLAGTAGNVAVGVLGVALGGLIFLRFPAQLRPIGLVAVGMAATLVVAALAFSYAYDVFIPATFGVRRLSDYASWPVILIGCALIEAALLLWRARRPALTTAVGLSAALAAAALVAPSAALARSQLVDSALARDALGWVRRNTPCSARVLSNQRTVGAFRVLTGRVAVLEGMGPFLRPAMLDVVVGKILDTRALFRDPAANRDFLIREGIDVVLVAKRFRLGYSAEVGTIPRSRALSDVPFLRPLHRGRTFDAYEVVGLPRRGGFPDPADHPAYRCRTDPIS